MLALGILVVPLAAIPAGPAQAADKAAVCAEARERYAAMEGIDKAPANTETVLMYKYTFCPQTLTVKAGTTVRFLNVDKRTSHSVWFKEAGQAESDRLFPEEMYSLTLQDAGTYPYLCGPHWKQEGMTGTLTVTP
ncbi:MAG: cupredoxin domain-containing protein [Rhodobacterales bacterium]|nr:cupredoxin domain-containing protein [Rhodobacterales bacterium]